MINHVWTVFCSRASVDSRTNNVSLFDVIEEVATNVPLPVPKGAGIAINGSIVTLWARADRQLAARGTSRVLWERPDGTIDKVSQQVDLDLTTHERLRNINEVFAIPFYGPGRYHFRIEYRQDSLSKWELKARVPLNVNLAGPAVTAVAIGAPSKTPTKARPAAKKPAQQKPAKKKPGPKKPGTSARPRTVKGRR